MSALAEPDPSPALPSELPVLPLRRTVAFPLTLQPLAVNRPVSIETRQPRARRRPPDPAACCRTTTRTTRGPRTCRRVGTVGVIRQMAKVRRRHQHHPRGHRRACAPTSSRAPARRCARRSRRCRRTFERTIEVDAHVRRIQELIEKALSLATGLSEELRGVVMNIDDPLRLAYVLATLHRHEAGRQAGAARGERPRSRSCRRSPRR